MGYAGDGKEKQTGKRRKKPLIGTTMEQDLGRKCIPVFLYHVMDQIQ